MKNFVSIILLLTLIVSCKETSKEKIEKAETKIETTKTENLAVNLQSFQVDIEGMTCEIGCAKLIQSKLYKIDGVNYANIDFEHNNGIITYDSNKIKDSEIIKKIGEIAGGDLYSVSKSVKLDTIIN